MGFYKIWRDCCGAIHRVWHNDVPVIGKTIRHRVWKAACACPKIGAIVIPFSTFPVGNPIPPVEDPPVYQPLSSGNSGVPYASEFPFYGFPTSGYGFPGSGGVFNGPDSPPVPPTQVPEPSSAILIVGLAFMMFVKRKFKQQKSGERCRSG